MYDPHDPFGPEYVVEVSDPKLGMHGFLVIDNTLLGPGKGGIRMTPTVTIEEVARLARAMTWKNSIVGIPFGGAKAGLVIPAGTDRAEKKKHVQAFARALKPFVPKKYIAGPDVGSGEEEMAWFADAAGNWRAATGKPANVCMVAMKKGERCGIPHEFGSTGYGVAQATAVASDVFGIPLKGATVAIHGFGNVGTFTYEFLTDMGAKVVALADHTAVVVNPKGLDDAVVRGLIKQRKTLSEYPGKKSTQAAFWKLAVDFLIPASVTDVINEKNMDGIRAKVIVEAGNIPMREHVEDELFQRGIQFVPDFVANGGGVISSYAEYRGYHPKRMFDLVERKIRTATRAVLTKSLKEKRNPRVVAMELARKRVEATR